MTRGKYAARATNRREVAEVEASEAAYQRQIVRLTKERDEARAELAQLKKSSATEARALRAQISEGTSDLVTALRLQVNGFRDERDKARREMKEYASRMHKALHNIRDHFISQHGVAPGIDAAQEAFRLVGVVPENDVVFAPEERPAAKFGADGVELIRQARAARGRGRREAV